jgi:hypothetical protein
VSSSEPVGDGAVLQQPVPSSVPGRAPLLDVVVMRVTNRRLRILEGVRGADRRAGGQPVDASVPAYHCLPRFVGTCQRVSTCAIPCNLGPAACQHRT